MIGWASLMGWEAAASRTGPRGATGAGRASSPGAPRPNPARARWRPTRGRAKDGAPRPAGVPAGGYEARFGPQTSEMSEIRRADAGETDVAKALVITEKPSVARDIVSALGGFTEHDGYWESDDARRHVRGRPPVRAARARRDRPALQALDPGGPAHRPGAVPAQEEEGADGPGPDHREAPRPEGRRPARERLRRRPRGRAYLPRDREVPRQREADRAALAPVDDGGGHPGRLLRAPPGRRAPGARRRGRVPRVLRLADRHERDPGAHEAAEDPAREDRVVRRPRADADARAPRRARGRGARPRAAAVLAAQRPVRARRRRLDRRLVRPRLPADDDDERRDDRIFDEARARAIAAAVEGREGVARETRKPSREAAPPLFDLTSLQREGNRRFGWSARRTLSAAQRCYEAHKLLTYPRTDSRCLPNDYRARGGRRAAGLRGPARRRVRAPRARLLERGLENEGRTFDDSKVSDHFAIIPTGAPRPPRSPATTTASSTW